jgi:two-component system phosphate regulon response regulator PhoB
LADQIRSWLRCAAEIRQRRDRVAIDGLSVDRRRFAATLDGRPLPLTPTQLRLLWTLARHAGQVFSHAQLCEVCRHDDLAAQERTIDVHIKSIRQKLAHRGELIETVRGVGYRMRSLADGESQERRAVLPVATN